MDASKVEDIYELSPMQQAMLFQGALDPSAGVYIEQFHAVVDGALDVGLLERAWQEVLDRCAALRASFHWEDIEKPLQIVHREAVVRFEHEDWRGLSGAELEARLEAFLAADRERGFELGRPPLMRWYLLRLADERWRFVWSAHHLLMDGWSVYVVLEKVLSAYEALLDGREPDLDGGRPFGEYVAWLDRQDLGEAEAHWRRTLAGFTAPTPLGIASPAAAGAAKTIGESRLRIPAATTAAAEALAKRWKITPSTLVQGIWAILLSRYSGEQDVVFGTVVSGRPADLPGVETMVGNFINTLPVRVRVDGADVPASWLAELQARHSAARHFEFSPPVAVARWSDVPAGSPLFESILVFENYPSTLSGAGGRLSFADVDFRERPDFPLLLECEMTNELALLSYYHGNRFEPAAIDRMLRHFRAALENLLADPERRPAEISLLSTDERRQLLAEWSTPGPGAPQARWLHQPFEERAAASPGDVALEWGRESLSYGELNRRANQLAHHLRSRAVGSEVAVGIAMGRGADVVVAILAVLKAGGAYVTLDPTYPQQRLDWMLEDLAIPLVLTLREHGERFGNRAPEILCLDDAPALAEESTANPSPPTSPDQLAYVTYTSGSSGTPKAVGTCHRGAVNYLGYLIDTWGIAPTDVVLQATALSFDASVRDLLGPLSAGGRCVLLEDAAAGDPQAILAHLREHGVSCLPAITPSLLGELLTAAGEETFDGVRLILSSGEALPLAACERARRVFGPSVVVVNQYGPTECTMTTSYHVVEEADEQGPGRDAIAPLGRAIPNTRISLLDRRLEPVPAGVEGEISIAGEGLGRGYLGRPQATAAQFLPDPFARQPGARLYKTGDLARYRADGNLRFAGRFDHQVKLRGLRIELGEIESLLAEHPAVDRAVVAVREDRPGDQRLVAYVVPAGAEPEPLERLRDFLDQRLPGAMVPSSWVVLEALPLTSHGKVDRRSLPAPDRTVAADDLVAPSTPAEETLARIWEQLLGIERVGVDDDFFRLGGHSLLIMRLQSRIHEAFQLRLPLHVLFETATISRLALEITRRQLEEAAGEDTAALLDALEQLPADAPQPLGEAIR